MAETVRPPEFSSEEEVAHILLRNQVFQIADYPKYKWSGGLKSPFYSNLRILHRDVDGSTRTVDHLVSKMQFQKRPDFLAGVVSAGPPWARDVATRLRIGMVPVRPEPKDHGAGDQVEGIVYPGEVGVIIEDTVSKANGIIKSAMALREKGVVVDTAYAILSYELFSSRELAQEAGINLITITTLPKVIEIAESDGYWSPDELGIVKDWHKDPIAWASKFEK